MPTPIDLLAAYILPTNDFALDFHLATSSGAPIYVSRYGSMVWEMKGSSGYPWDMNTFDENWIYQSITELNYTDPTAFKIFASSSWPGANGGVVWMPRWFTPGIPMTPVVTKDSTYRTYPGDAKPFSTATLGGQIETFVDGPFEGNYAVNFGGDIGTAKSSIRQTYKWGPNYANMEVNYYAAGYGRCQWELWTLGANGQYTRAQVSAFNTVVAGGTPALDFPQSVPVVA